MAPEAPEDPMPPSARSTHAQQRGAGTGRPEDTMAACWMGRSVEASTRELPPDWTGVEELTSKQGSSTERGKANERRDGQPRRLDERGERARACSAPYCPEGVSAPSGTVRWNAA